MFGGKSPRTNDFPIYDQIVMGVKKKKNKQEAY